MVERYGKKVADEKIKKLIKTKKRNKIENHK
jgi:hypothetical protein